MVFSSEVDSSSSEISNNVKIIALEWALKDSIVKFRDLVLDLEQLHTDSESYKQQYLSATDKCEKKTCRGSEELKKVIANKDQIIQSVASLLTKLDETKNFDILVEAFKILFEEAPISPLTPPTETRDPISTNLINITPCTEDTNTAGNKENEINIRPVYEVSRIQEANCVIEDVSVTEQSLCEIEGTPTGRKSPIIPTKKIRNALVKSTDFRDKKKCPDDWPIPQSKAVKLIFPTSPAPSGRKSKGTGRLRQSRINLVKLKQTSVVDLTCSPELKHQNNGNIVQPLIKKESIENDDTILPSPTSGPTNFTLFKTSSKASPNKFKKPQLSLKSKGEVKCEDKHDVKKDVSANTGDDMDESINILNQFNNRLRNGIKKENKTPVKMEVDNPTDIPVDDDATHCDSLILQADHMQCSPPKRPLGENVNIMNTPPRYEQSSASILPADKPATAAVENVKRKIPELVEPLYKEAAARSKAEKRNLQGWSCEECKNFYGTLYKNDPIMLAKKIHECSKHRGRHNPARPKTPPNFWNPRWDVPEDTEELNRMNNAT